jgi:transcriptional regulator with XRE-family HTH domain
MTGSMVEPWRFHLMSARDRDIAQRIRNRRKELRWSAASVAVDLGISTTLFFSYEMGNTRIPAHRLPKIAEALGVSEAWLRDGAE